MRVIVCGSRDWTDEWIIERQIASLVGLYGAHQLVVVHGAARGADQIAGGIARRYGAEEEPHPADWRGKGYYDPGAGHDRNREMAQLGARLVLAFKDGFDWTLSRGGTENMVSLAITHRIPYYVIGRVAVPA